jgi:hypothetical protein
MGHRAQALSLPCVLGPRLGNGLPLEIRDRIGATAGERDNMIFPVTRTGTGRQSR